MAAGTGPALAGSSPDIRAVDDRLDAVAAAVAEARRRVERGEAGGAGALAETLGEALREAAAARTVAPAATRARLVALLDEVGALLEAIERERAAAGMRLRELAMRGRAGHAYGIGR